LESVSIFQYELPSRNNNTGLLYNNTGLLYNNTGLLCNTPRINLQTLLPDKREHLPCWKAKISGSAREHYVG
jgi:hypothetical protein